MTTSSKELYEHLLELGAPKLPDGYFYKFWIAPKELKYKYIKSEEQTAKSQALYCSIRKQIWGGLFYKTIQTNYFHRNNLSSWGDETYDLIRAGRLKESNLDGTWHLVHMAYLAEEANECWRQAQRKAAAEAERKKTEPAKDARIKPYLNKRLP